MQLPELKEHITKHKLLPLYIFTGEEVAIMDIYLQKMGEIVGNLKRVDSVSSIYGKMQNHSFASKNSCYVVRDDKEYLAAEKVWESLNNGSVQRDNVVVLIFTSLDKRSKFYKRHTDAITTFEKMSPEVLAKYIKKEIGLEGQSAKRLAEICECDYSRILLECNKLSNLSTALKINIEQAMKKAVDENLFFVLPKDAIFDLVDAICRRNVDRCFDLWRQSLAVGESPIAILSVLYNNMRAMLLVQSAGAGEGICDRTGLTPFQVKLAKEKIGQYNIGELVNSIMKIREVEKGIKTGAIEQDMSIDYVLTQVL